MARIPASTCACSCHPHTQWGPDGTDEQRENHPNPCGCTCCFPRDSTVLTVRDIALAARQIKVDKERAVRDARRAQDQAKKDAERAEVVRQFQIALCSAEGGEHLLLRWFPEVAWEIVGWEYKRDLRDRKVLEDVGIWVVRQAEPGDHGERIHFWVTESDTQLWESERRGGRGGWQRGSKSFRYLEELGEYFYDLEHPGQAEAAR